jgi:hypothetical protein
MEPALKRGLRQASTGLYVRARPGLRLRDKKVERLVRKMRTAMYWLESADLPACRAWAELEYLSGQVYAVLRAMGVQNSQGESRRLLDDYRKLRQTQAVYARELGMTPAARMAIKATGTRAAFDLTAAMANAGNEVEEVLRGETQDGCDVLRRGRIDDRGRDRAVIDARTEVYTARGSWQSA